MTMATDFRTFDEYLAHLASLNGELLTVVAGDVDNLAALSSTDLARIFELMTAQGVGENDLGAVRDDIERARTRTTNRDIAAWMHGLGVPDLQQEALRREKELGKLSTAELERVCTELRTRGVTQTWIQRTLRPAVKRATAQSVQAVSWRDYVTAAEDLGYTFRLNDMSGLLEVNEDPMSDVLEATLLSHLHERGYKNVEVARRAFLTSAGENRYHPVRDYLLAVPWDGKDHIAAMAAYFADSHAPITYADGTERSVFHAVMRRWLVGAVAKIMQPGGDSILGQNFVPILDGAQGKGKSTFVKWLCPFPELFVEKSIDPTNKDFDALLVQRWIWEIPELGALMRKADGEALKAFLSTEMVTYRPPYGRHAITRPAAASFIATVNFEGALLSDSTGHRRFFPITLTEIDHGYFHAIDKNQVWAQATALYRAGETWRPCEKERAAHAQIVQRYEVEDILQGHILKWFDVDPGANAFTYTVDILERLREKSDVRGSDDALVKRLARSLHSMGCRSEQRQIGGRRGRGWWGIKANERF